TSPPPPLALLSFPTRRSSDLPRAPSRPSRSSRSRRQLAWRVELFPPRPGGRSPAKAHPRLPPSERSISVAPGRQDQPAWPRCWRSEEHTSELQSRVDLVCRLL